MPRIFIGGTKYDLKEYRDAVIQQLRRMREEVLEMDYFPTSSDDPETLSLQELETADIYLGIIGHRYGTVLPGDTKPIVQREYERALQLQKERDFKLLLYLADEDRVLISPKYYEPEAARAAQISFRKLLSTRHTIPPHFIDPSDLASRVAGDLYQLLGNHGQGDSKRATLFDADQVELIQEEFDNPRKEHLRRIGACVKFVADQFSHLFTLDRQRLDVHPFLRELMKVLGETIPGVALDEKEGVLSRTGVRHVILRAETFRHLVSNLENNKLAAIGYDIGQSAAKDLVEHTVRKKKLIPKSPGALITLWDYWDRTGGWGKLVVKTSDSIPESLEEARRNEPEDKGISTRRMPSPWTVHLKNNSLAVDSAGSTEQNLAETHRLAKFWCGYARGFLDVALVGISDFVAELDDQERDQITLPAYNHVKAVEHSYDEEENCDDFVITFEEEQFSESRLLLAMSQADLANGKPRDSQLHSKYALEKARQAAQAIAPGAFDKAIESMMLSAADREELKRIQQEGIGARTTTDKAERRFKLVNLVVQHLSRNLEERTEAAASDHRS